MATFVHLVGYMGWVTSKGNEVKDETSFRYAHDEVLTQVVVICDPTHYQLDHRDTFRFEKLVNMNWKLTYKSSIEQFRQKQISICDK